MPLPRPQACRGTRDLRHDLALHVARETHRARFAIPVGIGTAVLVHAGEVSGPALGIWVAVALADFVRHVVFTTRAVRSCPGHGSRSGSPLALASHASFGVTWGSQVLVAALWGSERSMWLACIVALAALSMYVVVTAGSRSLFAVGTFGALVPAAAGMLLADDPAPRLALATGLFGGIAFMIHANLHRSLVDAIAVKLENARLAEELRRQLDERDPMTGLFNRDAFSVRLERLAALGSYDHRQLTVAVANIRRLGGINELHGEEVGSAVLVHLAARLASRAPDGTQVARLGGDEFAVATVRSADASEPTPAELLDSITDDPVIIGGLRIEVDATTAEATGSPGEATGPEVLAEAIARLREVRHRARPKVDPAAVGSVGVRRDLADRLSGGLQAAGIETWFQPIVDARERRIVAWEALARWRHPGRGVLVPAQFMPMLAGTGRQHELLDLVVADSCRLLRALDGAGVERTVVHLNLTAGDLHREGVSRQLVDGSAELGVSPDRLVVELTEQDIVELDGPVRMNLAEMWAWGIKLAVDDFGTGYSSLSHLVDLPTDHLKIDRRFVTGLLDDETHRTLVAGLLGLARGLGIQTVAEGVETEVQATLLAGLGCTQLQGHLFAPALPAADAVAVAVTPTWATRSLRRVDGRPVLGSS